MNKKGTEKLPYEFLLKLLLAIIIAGLLFLFIYKKGKMFLP